MVRIAAIDRGYGHTKVVTDGNLHCFPSVVGEAQYSLEDRKMMTVKGKWLVGEDALDNSLIKRHSRRSELADSPSSQVLIEAALNLVPGECYVVSGLPVDMYGAQKGKLETLLLGYKEKVRSVKIVPQPYAGLMDFLLDEEGKIKDEEVARQPILGVDIGTGTLGLLGLFGMKPIQGKSRSVHLGSETALQAVAKIMGGLTVCEVDREIREGRIKADGALYQLAEAVIEEVMSLRYGWKKIFCFGGGADLLKEWIPAEWEKGDQVTVARGMWKIGKRQWAKSELS
ncbi:ParM/StbA family protein [Heliobacterium chlorum]|uniref:ParM/StbA family protein n=1 Tax=Heliobacterium chlorum TaxID=2698 RepID=A0ABR7SZY3_HELCL|nr:ParM/StbA family protein [Heliobacterium chlorum]MBC9783570.1 ParM/StbA family protein [Heliobacterium chlorum]